MDTDFVLQLLMYTIPAVVVAFVSYVYFSKLIEKQTQRDRFIIENLSKSQFDSKALKLQACERLVILGERINIKNLLLRINPTSEDINAYQFLLTQHIEQEYEYNIAQQLYVSNELWDLITSTKNTTIQYIQVSANQNSTLTASAFRSRLLQDSVAIQKGADLVIKAINEEAKHHLNS
ncbi:MAG: hypothetical protein LBE34_13510 [Flavobacteriaceae bacterium]|jgi:hypothetical protein|nr:hypothetical protein [Flavobacteriaceae bacterium]